MSVEEEVKIKIVLKWLEEIGIRKDELEFEKSFSLRIGTYKHDVQTEKDYKNACPRLDILVKRNQKNLFVIETKSSDTNISQKEIDQACSYARLIHPIAPFFIVTNGKEFKLFYTIEKSEVQKDDFKLRDNYDVKLPDDEYLEALSLFIGYSPDNLKKFCSWQVEEYMSSLKGSETDPFKKYIPELYVPPEELNCEFQNFIESNEKVFSVTAASGMGKTCWICNTTEQYLEKEYPVFFYRLRDCNEGIIGQIADDINWELSPNLAKIEVMKRILSIFSKQQKDLLIFIDGCDEVDVMRARKNLEELIKRTKNNKCKIILTCKSNIWPDLKKENGIPTSLFSIKVNEIIEVQETQFFIMLEKYKEYYSFKGIIQSELMNQIRHNPFFMRLAFVTAKKENLTNLTYSIKNIFKNYIDEITNLFDSKERLAVIKALVEIAKKLFENKSYDFDEILEPIGKIPEKLYDINVLEKNTDGLTQKVSFYFSKIRDFVIAFYVLRLDEMSNEKLREHINNIGNQDKTSLHTEVLSLYYLLAKKQHKEIIDYPLRDKAICYVDYYSEILNTFFPNIKTKLPPFTNEDIGFIGHFLVGEKKMLSYGFIPLTNEIEKIQLFPTIVKTEQTKDGKKHTVESCNMAFIYGAKSLHFFSTANAFVDIDIKREVLLHEVLHNFENMVKIGFLDESMCISLLIERVLAVYLKYYSGDLSLILTNLSNGRFSIDFRSLREIITSKDKAEIPFPLFINLNKFDYHSYNKEIYPFEKMILDDLNSLNNLGIDEIDSNQLFLLDSKYFKLQYPEMIKFNYDEIDFEIVKDVVKQLLSSFLQEYKVIIEQNFTCFSKYFNLYNFMPCTLFVLIEGAKICYTYCKLLEKDRVEDKNNIIMIKNKNEVRSYNDLIEYNDLTYKSYCTHWTSLTNILSPYLDDYLYFEIHKHHLPIRNLVYKQIQEELEPAFTKFIEELLSDE